APTGVQRTVHSAYDDPGTAEEMTRRTFMANATLAIGGVIGLGLAIPIVGSLLPSDATAAGNFSPLTAAELTQLQTATSKPVKLTFQLKAKDSYLPEQSSEEYVWGIKVDPVKFEAKRPNLFKKGDPAGVGYEVVNLSFVILSPICPHLGCRFDWNVSANKFLCPCHGSQFNFDGEHLAGPAPRGLDPLPLREQSGVAEIMWVRYKSAVPDRIVISYQS
ncbi:MAG: Rieske 2Fe-2S domain-containing protein, partial [Vulcanimicrobiaceae bacterium]